MPPVIVAAAGDGTICVDGRMLGGYRILHPIGNGGMGTVFVAEHVLLGRRVAIKVLQPFLSRHAEAVDRFFGEARTTSALRHPGIVEVFDFGFSAEGSAYLVMELLDGETLRGRLARVGRLPVSAALEIARRIALPLAAAHHGGVIHRDLKPDNVFLVADADDPRVERVKLIDFGIAKLAGVARTGMGMVLGTPAYMAPEQCRGDEVDERADLYALGCVLYEMLAGAPLFGGDVASVVEAQLSTSGASLARKLDAPPEVTELVARLLAKDPGARPRSAAALVAEIDAILARQTAPAPLAGPPPRRRLARLLVGIGLAVASVGVYLALLGRRMDVPRRDSGVTEITRRSAPGPVVVPLATPIDAGVADGADPRTDPDAALPTIDAGLAPPRPTGIVRPRHRCRDAGLDPDGVLLPGRSRCAR